MGFEITITLLSFVIELLLCCEKNVQEDRFREIETLHEVFEGHKALFEGHKATAFGKTITLLSFAIEH